MTHPMYTYLNGCHKLIPHLLRHRYRFHRESPNPYVIAIYRSSMYCRPDIATCQPRDHDSFLFIVRVLLGQTIYDSSYVYKWLP